MKSADERIANMIFGSVFPHYLSKIEKKGRSKEELLQVIEWLTGYNELKINELIEKKINFKDFFAQAQLPANYDKVTGVICGVKIELIENILTKKARILDKLVDELAKGKKMEKIIR